MTAATQSSTTSATVAATVPFPGDLVNDPVANPAQERYPGSVDPTAYVDKGPSYTLEGPVNGPWVMNEFSAPIPNIESGGGIEDYAWTTGTDGPMVPFDSNAGEPFAPSGHIHPWLHGEDTGQVFIDSHVVPAAVGAIRRTTKIGQTYNREFQFDPVTGEYVPAPNARTNMDQRQTWDPSPHDGGGYAPWDPGYAERPIYNNVAYQVTPVTTVDNQYGVSGDLPDRSQYQAYLASSYEAPPDPIVNQPATPAASTAGGWLLGLWK